MKILCHINHSHCQLSIKNLTRYFTTLHHLNEFKNIWIIISSVRRLWIKHIWAL